MSSSETAKFTPKEQQRISTLESQINNPKLSTIERQIADAELSALKTSKMPPSHNHKHRMQGGAGAQSDIEQIPVQKRGNNVTAVGKKDHDMFHNDEAFERYEMGGDRGNPPTRQTEKRGISDWESLRFNHHARGGQKMRAEDDIIHEELTP
ncbi:hypothetical protein CVT24_012523 [Panaeolus cyanescens]|uniref:Uncharacterized protein n=1 Tax=Panaeolus cyanescens TaxID=181874 RepID=A0A409YK65_9AGAR|nr:hypothetical protein CVT24_012523 [Panaeolus cyanescens]